VVSQTEPFIQSLSSRLRGAQFGTRIAAGEDGEAVKDLGGAERGTIVLAARGAGLDVVPRATAVPDASSAMEPAFA
jgi:hypothetical protein